MRANIEVIFKRGESLESVGRKPNDLWDESNKVRSTTSKFGFACDHGTEVRRPGGHCLGDLVDQG